MLNIREKEARHLSQGGIMHLGSVGVQRKKASWQRTSSGGNPADEMCTNYELTD